MLFSVLFCLAVASDASAQRPNYSDLNLNPVPPQDLSTAKKFNFFDLELLQTFNNDYENFFISPASIKITLAMILEGARGTCAAEIRNVLRLSVNPRDIRDQLQKLLYAFSDKSGSTIFETANAVFVSDKYRVLPEYERNVKQFFGAEIEPMNFTNTQLTTNLINSWVQNVTRGLIPELVGPENLKSDAKILIANALYFKGLWRTQFDGKSTSVKCFESSTKKCINVYMMQIVDVFNYKQIDSLDAHAVEIPYNDGKYAMLLLLPKTQTNTQGLIRDLQHFTFAAVLSELEPNEILLDLPKFEIEYSAEMVPALELLGIQEIFRSNANLSGIIEKERVKVNNIIHKTKIVVNERGTEAAAASGAVVIPLMGSSMPRVVADHPFLFFIYHVKSGNIIFEGKLNEPEEVFQSAIPVVNNQGINYVQQSQQGQRRTYDRFGNVPTYE